MKKLTIALLSLFLMTSCALLGNEKTSDTKPSETETTQENILKGKHVPYGLSLDSDKWIESRDKVNSEAEYEFEHVDGDIFGLVIAERVAIPIETLKKMAFENAQTMDPNIEITYEESIEINGEDILVMKMEGNFEGIDVQYFGYYYSGEAGSIQVLTYSEKSLMEEYANEITELLNGFEIYDEVDSANDSDSGIKDRLEETIEGEQVDYEITYDTNIWSLTKNPVGDAAEYSFDHIDGDVFALVIPERIQLDKDTLKEIALENAQEAAADMEIISEEKIEVNGENMTKMKMEGTIEGVRFQYYGYYYVGEAGSIQFVSYTSTNLMEEYEKDLTDLLNGLRIQ